MEKEKKFDFKSLEEQERYVKIPADILSHSDGMELDMEPTSTKTEMVVGRNSRCVSVDTFSFAPLGRKEKKGVFKRKGDLVKFRCTVYEKKLLKVKSKRSGLSLSEYIRRSLFDKKINDFKNGVEKLEKFNDQLKHTKIKMDLTEYKSIIEAHQQQMASHLNSLKSFETRFLLVKYGKLRFILIGKL